jgi:hypothetical protein
MIEQLARRVIVLLLFVMILPTAVVVIGRIVTETISMHAPGTVGPVGGFVLAFLAGLFVFGLLVRLARTWRDQNAGGAQVRAQELRQERLALRTLATDVPLEQEEMIEADDPDPAVPLEGE